MPKSAPGGTEPGGTTTQPWEEREEEVDAHVEAGRVVVHDTTDAFLAYLDALARR